MCNVCYFQNIEDEVGYGIGVVSSVFYTFSRLGQMWKNVSSTLKVTNLVKS
jgi:hypothetical protein